MASLFAAAPPALAVALALGLSLSLSLAFTAPSALAQAETQPSAGLATASTGAVMSISPEELQALLHDKNQLALYHYGSRYTFDVLLGGIAGGILGSTLYGGPMATITGSSLGSFLGILWFLDRYAGDMIEKHGW
jgi:hypothetical protein